jgi:hypothetical protein
VSELTEAEENAYRMAKCALMNAETRYLKQAEEELRSERAVVSDVAASYERIQIFNRAIAYLAHYDFKGVEAAADAMKASQQEVREKIASRARRSRRP